MSQQSIIEYLKKHKEKWFSCKELAEGVGVNFNSANCSLRKLRYAGFVAYKETQRYGGHLRYVYSYKPI